MSGHESGPRRLSRRGLLRATGSVAAIAGLSGLGAAQEAPPDEAKGPVSFSDPVRLNPPGKYGYEPSVDVDPHGTIYATAHKASVTNEGTRLASWFWYSIDGGDTWHDMPSNGQVDNKQYALEGDIAVDDLGRVYYVDTYAAENHINRWLTEPGGPVWDYSKPAQGTSGVDDRPWLNAHGDGIVYYLGNNGLAVPDPDSPSSPARIWFYRSTDGGLTWSAGLGLPTSGYASIAASKDADPDAELEGKRVYLATADGDGDTEWLELYSSDDGGGTWTFEGQDPDDRIYEYETASNDPFPTWSVTDRAGNPYHVTTDDDPYDETPGKVIVVRGEPGDWEVLDVTPFEGTFTKPWVGAGSEGLVAIVFYATETVDTGEDFGTVEGLTASNPPADWYPYALVTTEGQESNADWHLSRLADDPVATDAGEPEDFFECAVGPQDRIHVTFGREVDTGTMSNPTRTYSNNLFYVQGRVPGRSEGEGVDLV